MQQNTITDCLEYSEDPTFKLIYSHILKLSSPRQPFVNYEMKNIHENEITIRLYSLQRDQLNIQITGTGSSILTAKQNLLANFQAFVQSRANEIADNCHKELKKYHEVLDALGENEEK